jgi:alpha-N-arabinofuranosidase
LFGTFVEHMGRCVYTGIYEPSHSDADEDGFRRDVLALTHELGATLVRYPGGNFVSGYRWEDGVGPRDARPVRRDLAWHALETNQIGVNEFAQWAAKAGLELMYAFNLGTRGLQEALDAFEYLNHPQGTHLADLRREHGIEAPHGIKLFCLGNEIDGPWQLGHKSALEYGALAAEVAKGLRAADPEVELVVCGSSTSTLPTFGEWEASVLELTYDEVDYISAHAYYEEKDGDLASFLASAEDMEHVITTVTSIADEVGARRGSNKQIGISFDEWNVWYSSRYHGKPRPTTWEIAPRTIEDEYSVADAVVVGSLLITLLRHSDRVHIACMAQLVNVIAPIMTEPGGHAWRQTTFYPFSLTAHHARGQVIRCTVTSESHETTEHGSVADVIAVATHDPMDDTTAIFLVNRSTTTSDRVAVDLSAMPALTVSEAIVLHDSDPYASNSSTRPDRVVPQRLEAVEHIGSQLVVDLPAVSWSMVRLSPLDHSDTRLASPAP